MEVDYPRSFLWLQAEDIKNILKRYSNNLHGDDMFSIRACLKYVVNAFVNVVILSSSLVWRKAFSHKNTPKQMFKSPKKNNKHSVKNYKPVSLISICSKVFERSIYNRMFPYFIENNLISKNQSGFKPVFSWVNQLLAITHEIFPSFDDNYEVRGSFPWHFKSSCVTRRLFINLSLTGFQEFYQAF